MADIHLLKLNFNNPDFSIIKDIRKKVFLTELNISESELFDEFDKKCDHVLIIHSYDHSYDQIGHINLYVGNHRII